MDSDPISESTPKRRKIDYTSGVKRVYTSDNDDGDDLFDAFDHNTIPTQPLPERAGPHLPFTSLLENIQSGGRHVTQPTQPLGTPPRHLTSSPRIQVPASSPPKSSDPPSPSTQTRKRPLASLMAPPGTAFRRPIGVQTKPSPETIDLSFDDPPVEHSSDDEDDLHVAIKPTSFTRGGNRIAESPQQTSTDKFRSITSQFAYARHGAGDSASAYGGQSRAPRLQQSRQTGPARAQPVSDMTLDDILDIRTRNKVMRMREVYGDKPIRELEQALFRKKGNFDDAMADILAEDEEGDPLVAHPAVVDLTSSDMESNAAKTAARPTSTAKQAIAAPARTISQKYATTQKQEPKAPARSIQEKYAQPQRPVINRTVSTGSTDSATKPRRRLVQRKRVATPPPRSPTPEAPIEVESDTDSGEEPVEPANDSSLLSWLNSCTATELADMSNHKEDVASLVLSKRPFKSLAQIRTISDDKPTKSGRRSAKKAMGERVLDVCEEMWTGYQAVDQLVEKCELLGRPVKESMKKWGLDLLAATKDGELAITKLEETAHDSGIGTPTSSVSVEEEAVVTPAKRKGGYLKQPAMMSKELIMKDYQIFGLNWLSLLWSEKLSCILADDMGLGKTCQVISFLTHLKETGAKGPHLVVVPGSTLENWLREFQRFSPNIAVQPYYGSQAERSEQREALRDDMGSVDVLVTTYDVAVSDKGDNKFLRKEVRPNVCVFDEGHALKNSKSKRHRELMRIKARFRLLLTGTPLQNNLQELASLLNFIMPELFDELSENLESIFKFKATTKDTEHAALLSKQRIERARSMMAPFILRRKKHQVMRDLPAKHSRVEYCDMVPSQQALWDQTVETARQAQLEPQVGRGKQKNVHMTDLRFAALHPLLRRRIYTDDKLRKLQNILITNPHSEYRDNREDLVWKFLTQDIKGGDYALHKFCTDHSDFIPAKFTLQNNEWMDSGKVQTLKRVLESFISNGDRVLLFSQFTTMMDILESVFETLSIKFMRLDGDTQMSRRQDIIDQFTADESIPLFMLSTKAGGAGINLACANKVIIFDSSFNPQDDVQAENRAHRVGQTREVEVVRLVTRGTIEEQIHALGISKLALDSRVAGEGDAKAAESEGEKMVEKMFFEGAKTDETTDGKGTKSENVDGAHADADLKDQFRQGLLQAGVNVETT